MKRDLLVLVPYPEKDLAQLQAAAGDLRVVTLPETAPEGQLRQALESARAVIGEPPVALLQDLPRRAHRRQGRVRTRSQRLLQWLPGA